MYRKLTTEEEKVIIHKGTEKPFTGEYYDLKEDGTYLCKQCGAELFRSSAKFDSGCGWPSFDDQIPGAVKSLTDADGRRTEIQCAKCGAHLGHVFKGEKFTAKNTRYCVNSISLDFRKEKGYQEIVLGGGCFWCIEAVFQKLPGVTKVTSGYSGGTKENPTYDEVCQGETGHAEVVKIQYDPARVDLKKLLEFFFAVHDPTTLNRQGADSGTQYRSVIFYNSIEDKNAAENYIQEIMSSYSEPIVTEVSELTEFYKAEDSHQNYFNTHQNQPYCSMVIAPKVKKAQEKIKVLHE
ncbi:MAG TPA: methionine sulfoxide reductase [Lentisphaeria bacterium]|nr:MAG: methionine sulfoxide reductase [Lentisphaerae bacterium GWF2_38_69]HBM14790.1 methionine sulfoxide reductase [Lentisphaeria bacterium]